MIKYEQEHCVDRIVLLCPSFQEGDGGWNPTSTLHICKDCRSPVVRHTCNPSYAYPDGYFWLCRGACDKTGYGCAQPTSKTLEKPAQSRLPMDGAA